MRKKIKRWVIVLLFIYIIIGAVLYVIQDRLVFKPVALPANHVFAFKQPFKEVNLAVNKEKNLNIIKFTVADSVRKGVVLYFHGNRSNVEHYADRVADFTNNRYEVWIPDYPGFGKSTGTLTEQALYDDAMILYKMARANFGKDSIILYGRSLGSGIAAQLASIRDCKHLVLETPYYSMDRLMRNYTLIYPISWISNYHLPTNTYLKEVINPVTIFHGTDDGLVPYRHAKQLKAAHPKINLVTIEKGEHNNLNTFPVYTQTLNSLLQ
jgi:pimeloyl-ACP methyl ester carboxylesterase